MISRDEYRRQRKRLVQLLIAEGILRSPDVIRAFLLVPREEFVTFQHRLYAYYDNPLPTFMDQTISAPHMCAIMCEALQLRPGDKVLEVGTGTGYHAALCAEIVAPKFAEKKGYVVSIEIFPELVRYAIENLTRTGYIDRVKVICGDGSEGYPPEAPYDAILVTAAAREIPKPLIDQLAPGGRMVIPVEKGWRYQELLLVKKLPDGSIRTEFVTGCVFVPLRGRYGRS